VTIDTSCKK